MPIHMSMLEIPKCLVCLMGTISVVFVDPSIESIAETEMVEMTLEIADRGYVFANGEIVVAGTASELLSTGEMEKAYMGVELIKP